jgi:hypothetical protein
VQVTVETKKAFLFHSPFFLKLKPWHWQATPITMALVAVEMTHSADKVYEFLDLVFDHQNDFSDQNCFDMTPRELFEKLYGWAKSIGIDEEKMRDQLGVDGRAGVEKEMKKYIKYSRQNSIHVSPTVTVNGIVDNSISSSFSAQQWEELFRNLIKSSKL